MGFTLLPVHIITQPVIIENTNGYNFFSLNFVKQALKITYYYIINSFLILSFYFMWLYLYFRKKTKEKNEEEMEWKSK